MSKTTLIDFFLKYPHKDKPDVNYVSLPYFPKTEISNHKYKMTYKDYKALMVCYFKYVTDYLLRGDDYLIPSRLGKLFLLKYKIEDIGNKKSFYNGFINNIHSNNFRVIVRWEHTKYPVPLGKYWKLSTVKTFNEKLFKWLTGDITNINNIK